jgi:outer membrane protein assembly factor BamA
LGRTFKQLGSEEESWYVASQVGWAWELSDSQYLLMKANTSGHFRNRDLFRVKQKYKVLYYNQSLPFQTIVFGLTGLDLTRQLKYVQYNLGGTSGLRGYPANQFSGTKALIINLEDRFFSKLEVLTFCLGGAVFVDGGYAWNNSRHINLLADLRWDFGIGLRLGPTKAFSNRVIRLDLAKSASTDDYYISFGLGHIIEWETIGGN